MQNILFLMGVYPSYGGVEKVSTVLANAFTNKGHKVHIVSFEQPHPELAEKELNPSVELHKLEYPVYSKKNARTLHDLIVANDIGVIINQWAMPFYVARLCSQAIKGTDCKLIVVHHNLPNTNNHIKELENKIAQGTGWQLVNKTKLLIVRCLSRLSLRYVYEKCDKYIVLSPAYIKQLAEYICKKNVDKVIAIPNPITIQTATENDSFNNKENIVLYVGRIEFKQKRNDRLVDIWKNISYKHKDWQLMIVGDGPDRKDLEKRFDASCLERYHFEGFQDPLPYYKRSQILVLPSEYEGFPLVLCEAMSWGAIPVCSDSFSAAFDIIRDKESGFVTSFSDRKNKACDIIDNLLTDRASRTSIAKNAIKRSKEFSLDVVLTHWFKLIK